MGVSSFVCFALVCLFLLVLGAKKEEYDGGFRYVQVSTCFFFGVLKAFNMFLMSYPLFQDFKYLLVVRVNKSD